MMLTLPLIENKIYRRSELHKAFGGQKQGGISTPGDHPIILLFTGESGLANGYSDGWQDGVYRYFGEGQHGDMPWLRGNKAIRDHVATAKDLHLFEILKKPRSHVRYLGQFVAGSWEYQEAPDREGHLRRAIVFHLSPIREQDFVSEPTKEADLSTLREAARLAGTNSPERKNRIAQQVYIERSNLVRQYALSRAKGICECCGRPAPFLSQDGNPFLEVHHIMRLTDGGPDAIDAVAAICPNCHREAHHGQNSKLLNQKLKAKIEALERN